MTGRLLSFQLGPSAEISENDVGCSHRTPKSCLWDRADFRTFQICSLFVPYSAAQSHAWKIPKFTCSIRTARNGALWEPQKLYSYLILSRKTTLLRRFWITALHSLNKKNLFVESEFCDVAYRFQETLPKSQTNLWNPKPSMGPSLWPDSSSHFEQHSSIYSLGRLHWKKLAHNRNSHLHTKDGPNYFWFWKKNQLSNSGILETKGVSAHACQTQIISFVHSNHEELWNWALISPLIS